MKKILIVVDMQNDFVDGALGTEEAAAIVDLVVKKIEEFDGEIIVTYDTHDENYMDTREGRYLPVPHCIKGTYGWQLNEKVSQVLKSKKHEEVQKPTFGSIALVEMLKEYNEQNTEVELIGLCTDICVVSNALLLKANFPEMNIAVDARCCAGVTPESHKAALITMKMCQIDIIEA